MSGQLLKLLRQLLEAAGFPLAEVSDHRKQPDTFVWVDFLNPTRADLEAAVEAWKAALAEFSVFYQPTRDGRPDISRLRAQA